MRLFVLISDQLTHESVEEVYPGFNIQVGQGVWILADKDSTSSEVTNKLNIKRGGPRGIVTGIMGYYGLWDSAVWDKMAAWTELNE